MTRVFYGSVVGAFLAIPLLLGFASPVEAQGYWRSHGSGPLYLPVNRNDIQPAWHSHRRYWRGQRRARYGRSRPRRRYKPLPVGYTPGRSVVSKSVPKGTILIDTGSKYLYYGLGNGRSVRYGIGVGRSGFTWKGSTKVGRKAKWPSWRPPAAMRKRQPHLPRYMPGGRNNPLGARALYLYQGGKDTLYRIHGTNERWSIGRNVSSGCIRMLNQSVIDLYKRADVGTRVVVR